MTNEPQLSRTKNLSPVWFIPLLALIIAVWLALRAWQASGPIIQIEFKDASGIAVGKTHVRYRDVNVGEVKGIQLSDDFTRVQVLVEMDRHRPIRMRLHILAAYFPERREWHRNVVVRCLY